MTAADFDVVIGHCQAVTDTPAYVFAAELIAAYPDAKIILNTRDDLDAWYRSMQATFQELPQTTFSGKFKSWFGGEIYWLRRTFEEWICRFFYDDIDATGKWRYREHVYMIRGLVPKEKLLEWTVDDGWGPLCDFLGKEVPKNKEFPNGNMPWEFMEKIAQMSVRMNEEADANMRSVAFALTAFIGATIAACVLIFVY